MTAQIASGDAGLVTTVAANVRAESARRGMNSSELARAIGMNRSAANLRWNGHRQWQLEDLEVVARVLGVPVVELVRTRRDSNSQPSDLESGEPQQLAVVLPFRRPEQTLNRPPMRRLIVTA